MTASAPWWPLTYRRAWLRADVVAGLTASAVVIPKAMAYAVIAGLPVETGLYTALAAMVVYPFLGTSRALSVSTTSAIAALTAAQVVAHAATGTNAVAVAATLAALVAGVLLVARVLRLGFVANFISKPVLVGFEAGVGIAIIAGQLKSVLGVKVESHTTLGALAELPGRLSGAHAATMLVALAGIVVLVSLPRLVPRLSAPLVWVTASIAAASVFGLAELGVKAIGTVPAGLPSLTVPDLSLAPVLWPAALGIALMSFTESMAAARTFCVRDDPPVEADRELAAVGAANAASAFLGGMPAGGGASQTAVTDKAGARSQAAQLVGAGAVLVTLCSLSSVIGLLPQAALGALILVSAVSMIKPAAFRAIARVRRMELSWAIVTAAGVVALGTLDGVLVAVAVSILSLLYQANHPPVYAVAWNRAEGAFRRAGEGEGDDLPPGILILRTEGRLTFANAARAAEQMKSLVEKAAPRVVVLECSAIPDIEYTALEMLAEGERTLRERGISLWLAAVNPGLIEVLRRSRLGTAFAEGRVFPSLAGALTAFEGTRDRPAPEGTRPA